MKYAVFVLGLLAAFCTNAQNHLKDFSLKRSLKQDGLQFNFTVLDDDKKGVRHYSVSKFYFWTKAQHLQSTQGASSGQLLHGTFEAFYTSKQLARKGEFSKGLKNGTWNFWNKDGSYQRKERWRRGKLCGKQQFFDSKGELVRTEIIRGNKKKCIQSDTTILWKSFDRKTIILKDSLGRKAEIQNFKEGTQHGTQKYYTDGKLDYKVKYKHGTEIQPKAKQEPELMDDETELEGGDEKEPGKLKSLWNKLFSKKDKNKDSDNDQAEPKPEQPSDKKDKLDRDEYLHPMKYHTEHRVEPRCEHQTSSTSSIRHNYAV